MNLAERILNGDRKAVAELITLVENNSPESIKQLSILHSHCGNAHVIGVTGAPGCGKSTLIGKLTTEYRKLGKRIGIIAIDPTSPFTGGAFLGDRIRMQEHFTDKNVFIRSMGSRGSLGGIAKSTADTVKILDAFGKDIIFIETIGAGQADVEITKIALTLLVVTMPGSGDDIQAIKAGILETGDIFVINKADIPGTEQAELYLEQMLNLTSYPAGKWKPRVMKTSASLNTGIAELVNAVQSHKEYLKKSGEIGVKIKEKTRVEFMGIVKQNVTKYILEHVIKKGELEETIERIIKRQIDPYSAADKLVKKIFSE